MTAQIETSAEHVQMEAQRDMDQCRLGKAYNKFKTARALFLRAMERDKAVTCADLADQCIKEIRDEIARQEDQLEMARDMLEETK